MQAWQAAPWLSCGGSPLPNAPSFSLEQLSIVLLAGFVPLSLDLQPVHHSGNSDKYGSNFG